MKPGFLARQSDNLSNPMANTCMEHLASIQASRGNLRCGGGILLTDTKINARKSSTTADYNLWEGNCLAIVLPQHVTFPLTLLCTNQTRGSG